MKELLELIRKNVKPEKFFVLSKEDLEFIKCIEDAFGISSEVID